MLIIPTWDLMCFLNYTFFPFINLEIHNHENSLSHVLFNPSPTPAPSWTPVSPMSDLLILVSLFVDLSFVFSEKAMAPHSSTLALKIPRTEEPGRCSPWGCDRTRLSDFTFTFHFHALEKEMATHSSVLAWRIRGTGEPGGLPSMGSHRVRHD